MGLSLRTGKYGSYYGNDFNSSVALSQTQMEVNATYIYSYLIDKGWSVNAIAGLLGNMEHESSINPGRWEGNSVGSGPGYGLVQWTPFSKYTNWCSQQGYSDPSEMDNNLARIIWELSNNDQYYATSNYPESFSEFTKSTKSPYYLACAFAFNYERSWIALYGTEAEKEALRQKRGSSAEDWFTHITGETPSQPNEFTPRTEAPSEDNKYYIHTSHGGVNECIIRDSTTGSVLPNCVGYAWGRAYEIMGEKPSLSKNNAERWYGEEAVGYTRSQTPRIASIICWSNGIIGDSTDGAGHVAVVEKVNSDGSILTSNSDYSGRRFYTMTLNPGYALSGYTFQGFIYLPREYNQGGNTPGGNTPGGNTPGGSIKRNKKFNFVLFNRNRRRIY